MKLKDLVVDHGYMSSGTNYHSNGASERFSDFSSFYEEYKDSDLDYNSVYRFDIKESVIAGDFWMQIIIIKQRKGIYAPVCIDVVTDDDVPMILKYLKPHFNKTLSNWSPIPYVIFSPLIIESSEEKVKLFMIDNDEEIHYISALNRSRVVEVFESSFREFNQEYDCIHEIFDEAVKAELNEPVATAMGDVRSRIFLEARGGFKIMQRENKEGVIFSYHN